MRLGMIALVLGALDAVLVGVPQRPSKRRMERGAQWQQQLACVQHDPHHPLRSTLCKINVPPV
jgi:hypothetical protein